MDPEPEDLQEPEDIKTFPIVCVCLPLFWKEVVEGYQLEGAGISGETNKVRRASGKWVGQEDTTLRSR